MSGKQRLISEVFAQHKNRSEKNRSAKAKPAPEIETLDDHEILQIIKEQEIEILKQFDLKMEYGPCIGISRMERWERANRHGMNPPQEVRQLIKGNEDQEEYTHGLWHSYPL